MLHNGPGSRQASRIRAFLGGGGWGIGGKASPSPLSPAPAKPSSPEPPWGLGLVTQQRSPFLHSGQHCRLAEVLPPKTRSPGRSREEEGGRVCAPEASGGTDSCFSHLLIHFRRSWAFERQGPPRRHGILISKRVLIDGEMRITFLRPASCKILSHSWRARTPCGERSPSGTVGLSPVLKENVLF